MKDSSARLDTNDRDVNRNPCILTFDDEVELIASSIDGEVTILSIDYHWDNESVEQLASLSGISTASVLSCVVVLATTIEDRLEALQNLRGRLKDVGNFNLPTPRVLLAQAGSVNIMPTEVIVEQANLIASLTRQLAQLRKKNDALQSNLFAIESFLDQSKTPTFDKVFECSPGKNGTPDALELRPEIIVGQVLPQSSRGLVAVSLYVLEAGAAESILNVTLRTLEDAVIVGSWRVKGSTLKAGWNSFGVSRSLAGLRRTLQLEVEVKGGGHAPALSLSEVQPIERYRPKNIQSGKQVAVRHLAVQIWAGLPNVLVPDWLSMSSNNRLREIVLRDTALAGAQASSAQGGGDAQVITSAHGADLKLSWVGRMSVATMLSNALPRGTIRVTARCFVPDSAATSYLFMARVLERGGQQKRATTNPQEQALQLGASDWVSVAPGELGRFDLMLEERCLSTADLELCVRAARSEEEPAEVTFNNITALVDHAE